MTDHKNILPLEVISTGEAVRAIAQKISPHILCLDPEMEPTEDMCVNTTLFIISDDLGQISTLLESPNVPHITPILVLGTYSTPPNILLHKKEDRLVDYLMLPVTSELLLHKISFLQQVQKIAAEHYTNRTTLSKQLSALSTRDGLTGLYNRRQFTINLLQDFQAAQTEGTEISLLILNIDYFNKINKLTGLKFGDSILNELSARLTMNTAESDSCYRFSGEEFVVLMPATDLENARQAAEKIRMACSVKSFNNGDKEQFLTISVGVASLQNHGPVTPDEFISMAETALFMAKAEGRNRVQIFSRQGDQGEYSPQRALIVLRETLNRVLNKTKVSAISSLQLLAKNVVAPEQQCHIDTVSQYVALLCKQLNISEQHALTFQNAITLHNSIRFLLHNDLISKPETLTSSERETLNDLPILLTEVTDMFDYFANERTVLLCHSERYDGTGKPHGLKGNEIPLGARIFNIVDALAAMNSERPYREKLSPPEIIDELRNGAGKQFDPALVLHTLTLIENNNLFNFDLNLLNHARQDLINTFPELKI